jgi:murein DD-endopeptidase MepM/ murein hydrolase activator NlpD
LGEIAALYGVRAQQIVDVPWNQLDLKSVSGGNNGEPMTGAQIDAIAPVIGVNLRIPSETLIDRQLTSMLAPVGPRVQVGPAADPFLGYMLAQPLSVAPMTAYAIGGPRASLAGPVPRDWPYGSGNFAWPVFGWLSQGYREDHRAIDIAAPIGSFVAAADRGVVIRAGWNDQGYGLFVVIDHNIDYVTLYSHLNDVFVREGEIVGQGQVIGTVGSTGRSTGPHLHFEIRDFGRRTNPLGLLVR